MSVKTQKVCHVVTVEQQEVAFERVQDAVALIKLLSRAKVRVQGVAARPAVSACLRPAMGYTQPAQVRYVLDNATGMFRDGSLVDVTP